MNKIATYEFKSEIVKEYSATSLLENLGMADNTMVLYLSDDKRTGSIDWEIDFENGDGDSWGIGLWFNENKDLTDYDGVFSLSSYAIKFLEEQGFNCDYAK
jgi:hypothetical protein